MVLLYSHRWSPSIELAVSAIALNSACRSNVGILFNRSVHLRFLRLILSRSRKSFQDAHNRAAPQEEES